MATRNRRYRKNYSQDLLPIVRLWMLRILVPLGGQREFVSNHGFSSDEIAELLGLAHWIDPTDLEYRQNLVRGELRQIYQASERKLQNSEVPRCLRENIVRLADLVGLSDIDCRILEFASLIHNERLLDDTAEFLGHVSTVKLFHALSIILDLPEQSIRASLCPHDALARSGLISLRSEGELPIRRKLDLLSTSFADRVCTMPIDPMGLLRGTVTLSAPPKLALTDYGHVKQSLSVLRPYLRHAVETRRVGVNVLIYGAPGTGKSELTRVLALELQCELFEVASEDVDGDSVDGDLRLRAFRASQSFFANRRTLVLFDEIEDVFNDGNPFGRKSTAQLHKAWINRLLEENAVPTLWLSNSIAGLDPAFVRRFDMVFSLPVPAKEQRSKIIQHECGDLLDLGTMNRIAECETLAPAVIAKAASVVNAIRSEFDATATAKAFELLINNTLDAQGHGAIKKNDPNCLPDHYDPAFINADSDLCSVAQGLIQAKTGRLCLFGPPGTGKTAFGRWLAEQMSAPLIVRRASDLISMWLGETEKNIARAFKEAERVGAVLLIDEVDSFLQDRRGAQRSWEVSQVNEMLTQMESFCGVFVASTNLMAGLDQAALRRFDLKVKFDFLKAEQASNLLIQFCKTLKLSAPTKCDLDGVKRLHNLTPGDFAAVARQTRFCPITDVSELVAALSAECAIKENAAPKIGFV